MSRPLIPDPPGEPISCPELARRYLAAIQRSARRGARQFDYTGNLGETAAGLSHLVNHRLDFLCELDPSSRLPTTPRALTAALRSGRFDAAKLTLLFDLQLIARARFGRSACKKGGEIPAFSA